MDKMLGQTAIQGVLISFCFVEPVQTVAPSLLAPALIIRETGVPLQGHRL
jgi:hypothetical protein